MPIELRVIVQLIDNLSLELVWYQQYDRVVNENNLLETQDEIEKSAIADVEMFGVQVPEASQNICTDRCLKSCTIIVVFSIHHLLQIHLKEHKYRENGWLTGPV